MDRSLRYALVALASAGAMCFVAITYRVMTIPSVPDLNPVVKHLDNTLSKLDTIADHADAAAKNVADATGDWSDTSKAQARDVRTTIVELNRGISDVRAMVKATTGQIEDVGPLLSSARAATDSIPPALAGLTRTEDASTRAITDLDAALKNPDIPATLHSWSVTSNNAALMSTDAQNKFHSILYPPKCEGKYCWMLRTWGVVKTGTQLAEPAYYLDGLLGK